MSEDLVIHDFAEGVFTIRLNRPEARNALNRVMRLELAAQLRNPPKGTRVVVLRGHALGFCSGQDLSELNDPALVREVMMDEYLPIIEAARALDVPLVTAVEGACAGAGVSLALLGDVVLAARSSFFQIAFTRIGLVPDILVSYQLPRLIGQGRALGMALSGDRIEAAKAENWGMIWRAIADEEFEAELAQLSGALAKGASFALGLTRKLFEQSWQNDQEAQYALEADFQVKAAHSRDFAEGVRAFMEKRPPKFEGR